VAGTNVRKESMVRCQALGTISSSVVRGRKASRILSWFPWKRMLDRCINSFPKTKIIFRGNHANFSVDKHQQLRSVQIRQGRRNTRSRWGKIQRGKVLLCNGRCKHRGQSTAVGLYVGLCLGGERGFAGAFRDTARFLWESNSRARVPY